MPFSSSPIPSKASSSLAATCTTTQVRSESFCAPRQDEHNSGYGVGAKGFESIARTRLACPARERVDGLLDNGSLIRREQSPKSEHPRVTLPPPFNESVGVRGRGVLPCDAFASPGLVLKPAGDQPGASRARRASSSGTAKPTKGRS